MSSPERTIIRAIIPHEKDPNVQLRSPSGEYPAHIHEQGSGTWEETLRKLGRHLLGSAQLSVDQRISSTPGEIVYQTKPLDFTPSPDDLFQWR